MSGSEHRSAWWHDRRKAHKADGVWRRHHTSLPFLRALNRSRARSQFRRSGAEDFSTINGADRAVRNHAELAQLGHVSRVRMCQILMLTNLAPTIQEALLFLPKTVRGAIALPNAGCAVSRSSSTGTRRSSCFVPAWRVRNSEPVSSHLQTVHALSVVLKRAHFPALLRQVARDEATHGYGPAIRFDFGSRSA
jgi:hypothetical protein